MHIRKSHSKIAYNFRCFIDTAAAAGATVAYIANAVDVLLIFPNAKCVRYFFFFFYSSLVLYRKTTENAHVCSSKLCIRWYDLHMASRVMRRCRDMIMTVSIELIRKRIMHIHTHAHTQTHRNCEKPQKRSEGTKCERDSVENRRRKTHTHTSKNKRSARTHNSMAHP